MFSTLCSELAWLRFEVHRLRGENEPLNERLKTESAAA